MVLPRLSRAMYLMVMVIAYTCNIVHCQYPRDHLELSKIVCPNTNLCNSTEEQLTNNETSCFRQCSCNPSCVKVGNCCPDAPYVPTAARDYYPCKTTDEHYQKVLNSKIPCGLTRKFSLVLYRIIDDCPTGTTNSTLIERCLYPKSLQDQVIVSGKSSGIVYSNIDCAQCNSEKDVDIWRLLFNGCNMKNVRFRTFEDRNVYIARNCCVDAEAPVSFQDHMQCYEDRYKVIDRCNISGEWDTFDDHIQHSCEYNTHPYDILVRDPLTRNVQSVYPNIYCYLCNVRLDDMMTAASCPPVLIARRNDVINMDVMGIKFQSFQNTQNTCLSYQFYDPVTNVCEDVVCPHPSMVPTAKKCFVSLDGVYLLEFDIYFKINGLSHRVINDQMAELEYIALIKKGVSDKLAKEDTPSAVICDTKLINILSSNEIYCLVTVAISDLPTFDMIKQILTHPKDREILLDTIGDKENDLISLEPYFEAATEIISTTESSLWGESCVQLDKLPQPWVRYSLCPSVRIPVSRLLNRVPDVSIISLLKQPFVIDDISQMTLQDIQNTGDNDKIAEMNVTVCVDDYLFLLSAGSRTLSHKNIMLLIITLTVILDVLWTV